MILTVSWYNMNYLKYGQNVGKQEAISWQNQRQGRDWEQQIIINQNKKLIALRENININTQNTRWDCSWSISEVTCQC